MGIITFHDKPILEPYTIHVQNFNFERYLEYAHEDIICELLNGVLIIHSPASLEHELIFKFLLTLLDLHAQEGNLGLIVGSRFTMRLSSKWAPEPDIMFIASDSMIALHKFHEPKLFYPVAIMVTYVLAQYLIYRFISSGIERS